MPKEVAAQTISLDSTGETCHPAAMSSELVETLIEWHAEETTAAIFRSLLAIEILALTFDGVSAEVLDAIRNPLKGLYELSRDHDEMWEDDDV